MVFNKRTLFCKKMIFNKRNLNAMQMQILNLDDYFMRPNYLSTNDHTHIITNIRYVIYKMKTYIMNKLKVLNQRKP